MSEISDNQRTYLNNLFKVINDHIRSTERKYLIITGAYVALFSYFAKSTNLDQLFSSTDKINIHIIISHGIFWMFGLCVYIMQYWYRIWKEHYIDTSYNINKVLSEESIDDEVLPYWLRKKNNNPGLSIDSLLSYLSIFINLLVLIVASLELCSLTEQINIKILIVPVSILIYFGILFLLYKFVNKKVHLTA